MSEFNRCYFCGYNKPIQNRGAATGGVPPAFQVVCICGHASGVFTVPEDAAQKWNAVNPTDVFELSQTELHDAKAMERQDVLKALQATAEAKIEQGKPVLLVIPYDKPRKGRGVIEKIDRVERLGEIFRPYL